MGILPCPLPCHSNTNSHSDHYLQSPSNHSENSSSSSLKSSLSSEPSLPSVPSLIQPPPSQQQQHAQSHSSTAHLLSTLHGHSSSVFSLALAGNKHLFSGSSDNQIRSWTHPPDNSPPNNVVATVGAAVKSLVVSGDKLFSAHQDHKIRVWKIDHKHLIKCIATLPTIDDRFLKLFSANNYVEVRRHKKCTWVHHVDTVSSLAVFKDGSLLYSASWDRSFKIWRTADFRCLESVGHAHDDAINAIVVSNDGFVYTGSADKKIKVWKKGGGEKKHSLVATLEKHRSAVNALALSTDGCVLYSGACDRSILVWERDGSGHMVVVGALRGHGKAILCLAAVADLVCSGSADNTVRIWRRGLERNYCCLAVLEGHSRPVKCLAAAAAAVDNGSYHKKDGNSDGGSDIDSGTCYVVYSGGLDCEIKVWRVWVPFVS